MARRRGDEQLFALPAGKRGRVERSVDDAVRAARADQRITTMDAALVSLARSMARAVDVAEQARDVWALARVGSELRETLVRLRLDPTSRGVTRDSLAEFLATLGQPSPTDAAGAAVVGHQPDGGTVDVRPDGHADDAGVGLVADAMAAPSVERRARNRPAHG